MSLNGKKNWLRRLENLIEEDNLLPHTLKMSDYEYDNILTKIQRLKEQISHE